MHHLTLKAAVAKYSQFIADKKADGGEVSEQELKAAIEADEKTFDVDGVNEIMKAIANPETQQAGPKKKGYIVAQDFRDIADFSLTHYAGSDVSHFDTVRLNFLVEQGHVIKE